MKTFLLIILSCRLLSYAFPIPKTEEVTEEEMKPAEKYLEGSFPQTQSRTYLRSEDNDISTEKIRQKRDFSGLKVTGKPDSSTPAVKKWPRCGVPNVGAFSFFPNSPKWNTRNLTYSLLNYTSDMNSTDVDKLVKKAFSLWSNVSSLNFTRVSKNADIEIRFYITGPQTPFGEDIFGYAYGPGSGPGGDMYMNEAISWTKDNDKILRNEGTSLYLVFVHEAGHALGLGHSTQYGSVMFAEYTPMDYPYDNYKSQNVPDFESLALHKDDIDGIRHHYGLSASPAR